MAFRSFRSPASVSFRSFRSPASTAFRSFRSPASVSFRSFRSPASVCASAVLVARFPVSRATCSSASTSATRSSIPAPVSRFTNR